MACAGLLTVCLIRPPAPGHPRPPAPAPAAGPAGHALFQDVFRRADKNDDGKLSFEEFQNYFADGVLSPGELRELFSSIDGRPTEDQRMPGDSWAPPAATNGCSNLETEKLCDYFSERLGVYRPVLAALESLNCAVLTAMDTTKLEYERASKVDQFVTRFLLRETVSQLQALQSSLEGASDTLEAQAHSLRCACGGVGGPGLPQCLLLLFPSFRPERPPSLRGPMPDPQGGAQRPRCSGGSRSTVSRSSLTSSSARLPGWNPCMKRSLPRGPTRQVQVAEAALQDFHHALCCYVDFTGAQSHCLHVSAQKMLDNASFTLYEFWQDEASWRRHQQSACSKAFQRILIDHLRAPDTLTTVFFPASWWIMNNNRA
ncbi:N-terminal EF-hand calcium-binding protein 3 isoform X5 [Camelus bactrianus]|uniref:N-terminal EF-hand calcium-binding protein 3 isoform X5 n=1 Tax=Camelus bactrianus TaxID=9837 RepID=A0AC58NZP3_CAMBA